MIVVVAVMVVVCLEALVHVVQFRGRTPETGENSRCFPRYANDVMPYPSGPFPCSSGQAAAVPCADIMRGTGEHVRQCATPVDAFYRKGENQVTRHGKVTDRFLR